MKNFPNQECIFVDVILPKSAKNYQESSNRGVNTHHVARKQGFHGKKTGGQGGSRHQR